MCMDRTLDFLDPACATSNRTRSEFFSAAAAPGLYLDFVFAEKKSLVWRPVDGATCK